MSKRELSKAATRQKVIAAAKALWAEPGSYHQNGIRDLADAMGMSTGSVFSNFESKDDVWRAAFGCEPPVDSHLTRLGAEAVEIVKRIALLDESDLIFTATGHSELAHQVHFFRGKADMAAMLQADA